MASNQTEVCPPGADRSFGPHVDTQCRSFDFTLTFEDVVFVLVPATAFLLLWPARLNMLRREAVKLKSQVLLPWKLSLLAVLFALHLAFLFSSLGHHELRTKFFISSEALAAVAVLTALVESFLEDQRSVAPSDLLVLYFSICTLLYIPKTRTLWSMSSVETPRALWTTINALTGVTLVIESLQKARLLQPAYNLVTKEQISGFWPRSLFTWVLPLFKVGSSQVLTPNDMPNIDQPLRAESAGKRLEQAWKQVGDRRRLLRATFKAFTWPFVWGIAPRLALSGFTFCQPFLITKTVDFMTTSGQPQDERYGQALVGAFVLTYVGMALARAIYMRQTFRFVTMVRASLTSTIYKSTLSCRDSAAKDAAAVTLMGTDVERIVQCMRQVHEIWASIPEILLAIFLLSRRVSASAVVPPVISIVSLLAMGPVTARFGTAQKLWSEKVQKRVAVTSSMLGDMKAVKMLGLSKVLEEVITKLRVTELLTSHMFRNLSVWRILISNAPQDLAPFATFAVYGIVAAVNKEEALLSAQAFSSLALISLLTEPLMVFCQVLPTAVQAMACFGRIETYLVDNSLGVSPSVSDSDARSEISLQKIQAHPSKLRDIASFQDAIISWKHNSETVLDAITVRIQSGLTAVIGPVASGKTTLLASIIGETITQGGSLTTSPSLVAYCSQTPWIVNTTVRDNITGGQDFNQKWYDYSVSICCLEKDLPKLPRGDMTLAGSNGTSLSGGQRQRVSLARAVYSRCPIMVLDDVFSGLDPTTLRQIREQLLGQDGYARKHGISVVLSTHNRRILSCVDNLIVLDKGSVVAAGPLGEVSHQVPGLIERSFEDTETTSEDEWNTAPEETSTTAVAPAHLESDPRKANIQRRDGSWATYAYYLGGAGLWPSIIYLFSTVMEAITSNYGPVWLDKWSTANAEHPNQRLGFYLGIYAMLFAISVTGVFVQCWVFMIKIITNTALSMHSNLLHATLSAPFSFFQTTDVGAVTNRFNQDMDLVDMALPSALVQFTTAAFFCIAKLIVLCVLGKYLAACVPFLAVTVYLIQRYYLKTSRQVRLLDIEAKAPLYKHLLGTLQGVTTIRAFGWESVFQSRNREMLDEAQRPFYMLCCIQQWLTLVLDLVVAARAVVLVAVATSISGKLSAGDMGAALITVLTFNSFLSTTIETWTRLEISIGAVARIQQFVQETPSERMIGSHQTISSPPPDWPAQGAIRIDSVEASYGSALPPILRDLSLNIRAGEKVAICGPSGSGKSSLVLSLLRMVDLRQGQIFIDDQDLSTMEGDDVRSRINIIPQEPFFLPGTVKFNLDPHQRAQDDIVEAALSKVGLWESISAKGGLCADLVSSEWSHGERQLLCLARALLVPSKILILDEATSSVDEETEAVMQTVIEEAFPEQTIISVLHRFKFIERFDRVAVLGGGRLVECDTPSVLLGRSSAFKKLYDAHRSGK